MKIVKILCFLFLVLLARTSYGQVPGCNPSTVNFNSVTGSSMTLDWGGGPLCGDSYLVLMQIGSYPCDPNNSQSYEGQENNNFSLAGSANCGDRVVYSGPASFVNVFGLSNNTTYYFKVYAFNSGSLDYRTGDNPFNSAMTSSGGGSQPTVGASGIYFTNSTGTSIRVNWTNGNGNGRFLQGRQGTNMSSSGCAVPQDNSTYSASMNPDDANFFFGYSFCNSINGVYKGSTNYAVVTGLNPNTDYIFRVIEYNDLGGSNIYYRTSDAPEMFTNTGNPPNIQANNIAFSNATSNSVDIQIQGTGNGNSILLAGSANSPFTGQPIDGNTYACNQFSPTFGTQTPMGNGYAITTLGGSCSCSGPSMFSTVTVAGLAPGVTYYFRAFAANINCSSQNYLTTTDLNNPASFTMPFPEPGSQANNLTSTNPTETSMTLNWVNGSGTGRIVVMNTGSASFNPLDGTVYSANSNYSAAPDVGGGRVVYSGSGNSVVVTGLTAITSYQFKVLEYNGTGASINYNVNSDFNNPFNVSTLDAEPGSQPALITFQNPTINSHDLVITPQSGQNIIVLRKQGSSPTDIPIDGTAYSYPSVLGTSEIVYVGNNLSSILSSGMGTALTYYYDVFAYNGFGTNTNYRTIAPLEGSLGTLFAEPGTIATNVLFSNRTENSVQVSWTNGNGSSRLLVARTNFGFTDTPVDGTVYTPNLNFNLAGVLGSSRVIASGNGPVTVTGLTADTDYSFQVFEFNGTSNQINYLTNFGGGNPGNVTTLFAEPTAQPTSLTFNTIGTASMNGSFNVAAGSPQGYIVLRNTVTVTDVPLDATTYSAGNVIGTSTVVSVGSSTAFSTTGLLPGTTYYFAVFSYNGFGSETNYRTLTPLANSQITIATAPTSTAATGINQVSFNANWTATTGAASYRLDVSTDPGFGSFVMGYNDLNVGSVLIYPVNTNLTAGTTYYYRVRAVNAGGTSANSSNISLATTSPVANAASTFSQTSFNANWSAGTSATNYRLDVATDPGFTAMVGAYNDFSTGNVLTTSVTGLTAGTTYYYRMRVVTAVGTSGNSNTITTLTMPPNPVLNAASAITQTSFSANWQAATSTVNYFLDVTTDAGFTAHITGSPFTVASPTVTRNMTGLTAGTTYYYRVRAGNASGTSGNSGSQSVTTVPPNPVSTAASTILQTSFNANWTAAASATDYRLDVATNPAFTGFYVSGFQDLATGNVTTRAVTGLAAGTVYYYRIRAVNTGGTSGNSGNQSLTTVPPDPASTAATAISATGFTANWNSSATATAYLLDVSTVNTFASFIAGYNNQNVGNVTSQPITGLTAGTTYYYRVRATNTGGATFSGNSATQSLVLIPPAPASAAASAITNNSFTANWATALGATGYFLDVATDAGFTSFVTGYNNLSVSNVTTFSVTNNLSTGITYYYRVRASNANGTSPSSGTQSLTTAPPIPVPSAATSITQVSFVANWASSTGSTGYFLDVSTSNVFGSFVTGYNNLNVGNVLTYAVNTNLTAGTTYYYRVRASNGGGASASSSTITLATVSPVANAATSMLQTSFTANWTAGTNATNYRLDVATDPAFTTLVSGYNDLLTGNVLTRNVNTGLSAGVTYYYRIRVVTAVGTSGNSNAITALTIPPNPVSLTATTIAQTSFSANWSASTGATSYLLDVSTSGAFSSFVGAYNGLNVGNITTYVVNSGLSAGTTYFYRVRALNGSGTSGNSGNQTLITIPPNPVSSAATAITQTSFSANWAASTLATSYELDVTTDPSLTTHVSGSPFSLGNVLTNSVTGLSAGTTYYYQVRALNTGGTSGNSGVQSLITIPPDPIAITATAVTATTITANWNAAQGATNYKLDVASDAGFTSFVTGFNDVTVNTTSLTITGLSPNGTYYYRVRAMNPSGTSSNSNIINQLTLTVAPVANAASSVSPTGFTANWSATVGAISYQLDVASDSGFGSILSAFNNLSVAGTNSAVNNLTAGTTYYYRVRAVNATGSSVNSNTISQITVPPIPVAIDPTFITTSSFVANWNASTGADSYRLDVSADNFATLLAGFNDLSVSGNTTSVTGLSEGITYTYRVRAVNTGGTSGNSNTISLITVPPVPLAQAATNVTTAAFTANWGSVSGATSYLLDVSGDNFNSFLTGYNGKTLTLTSETISGLVPNTSYQYRVRANSASGTSANSSTITVLTYPSVPDATAATAITQTGFTANWTSIVGISSYSLDVSADDFVTMITGYSNMSVAGTSSIITGLNPGTIYKYRIRANNATGASANSVVISLITKPADPVANAATVISQNGFTANWNSVTGLNNYLLDISTSTSFSGFITGYEGKVIAAINTTEIVTGLTPGTTYNYRIRAVNASGSSNNSNIISQITIPANPVANTVTTKGSNNFIASWEPVTGASSYELDVTLFTANFTTYVSGYNARPVDIESTEELVVGLTSGTSYKFRVRAINAGGKSGNSNSKSVITDGGTAPPFNVTVTSFNNGQFSGSSVNVTGQVSNAVGAVTATLIYKGITEIESKEKPIPVSGTGYTIVIDDDMLDDLGIEFFVRGKDETDAVIETETKTIYRTFTSVASPTIVSGNFEGNMSSIKIISIPLDPKDNLIQSVFSSLGAYDKKGWRLAHYQDGRNVEYEAGINKIERGLGYWFNAKGSNVSVKTGEGDVGKYDQKNPFKLSLVQGWNQIGNPFPFPIDWSDVLSDNPNSGVGTLKVYDGNKENYSAGDNLQQNTGGFVFADKAVTLDIQVTLKNRAGRKAKGSPNTDISKSNWQIPFVVKQNTSTYDLGAIGMQQEASASKDQWDEIRLPRLDKYLDVTFDHPEYKFTHFTKDITVTSDEQSWKFSIESSGTDEDALLEWDNATFGDNTSQLFLLDVAAARFVDMRSVGSYSFINPGKKEFRVYYRRDGKPVIPDVLIFGTPYPNPATESVYSTLILPETNQPFNVEVAAINLLGQTVRTLLSGSLASGVHPLSWDGNDASGVRVPGGIYLIRARINDNQLSQVHKVIMK